MKNVSLTCPTAALSFCAHFHLVRHHLVKRIGLDLIPSNSSKYSLNDMP